MDGDAFPKIALDTLAIGLGHRKPDAKIVMGHMRYELRIVTEGDRLWLDELRREVYKELVVATFGEFDEARHQRHCDECWEHGNIEIVTVAGTDAGMIQLAEGPDSMKLCEIQLRTEFQGKQLGTSLVRDIISRSVATGKELVLSTGLKNVRAKTFYERLGFRVIDQSETHFHMRFVGTEP